MSNSNFGCGLAVSDSWWCCCCGEAYFADLPAKTGALQAVTPKVSDLIMAFVCFHSVFDLSL